MSAELLAELGLKTVLPAVSLHRFDRDIKFSSLFSEIKIEDTDKGPTAVPRLSKKGIVRGISFLNYVADRSLVGYKL